MVEDQPLTQNYLKYALENLGFSLIQIADQAKAAIALCEVTSFDLILCSFNLSGKDGYQLYEELKTRSLIRLSTGFIFISAETEPGLVHSVIELQPDDFLVKPFTLKDLDTRINRVLGRKGRLSDIYHTLDNKNYDKALRLLDEHLANPSYVKIIPQLLKIKGDILLRLKDFVRARTFFVSVLKMQKLIWAKIGLIRCLVALGQEGQAFKQLELLAEQPNVQLEALELLSDIQFKLNDYNLALKSLKKAVEISPRNIHRQDKLANIARINHEYEIQYKAHRDIVKYAKHSLHDKPELYLNAVRSGIDYALTNYNEEQLYRTVKQANDYLSELKTAFPDAIKDEQLNVINARIHYLKDEKDKAKLLINQLLETDSPIESIEDALDKAKSFHELGFYGQSAALFEQIDHHCQQKLGTDSGISAYVKQEKRQREEIKASPKELNNHAVTFYRHGNYLQAYHAFRQAFTLMPHNTSIALNLLQTIMNNPSLERQSEDMRHLIDQCFAVIDNDQLEEEQKERLKIISAELNSEPTPLLSDPHNP